MAQEIVGVKIEVGGGEQIGKSLGSLKQQLREAQQDVQMLSEKFGATSKEAVAAAKRAAELKDAIGDAKSLVDAFNPDAKFKALTASLSGVAGGFAAVQGAMGLFGNESKDLEKALLKVQSAMALSQGLQALGESVDSFKQLRTVAIDALSSIRKGLLATGIGAFIVALGTVVAYWDDITEAINGVSAEIKNATTEANKKTEASKKDLEVMDMQVNALKLQGKTEKEILQIRVQKTESLIKDAQIELSLIQKTGLAQIEKYGQIRKLAQSVLGAGGTGIADLILGGTIESTQKKYEEQNNIIQKSISDLDGFKVQIKEIEKKDTEARNAENKKRIEDAAQTQQELDKILRRNVQQEEIAPPQEVVDMQTTQDFAISHAEFLTQWRKDDITQLTAYEVEQTRIKKENADAQAKIDKEKRDSTEKMLEAVSSSLANASDILGTNTATGKALAVASAVIDTYSAISKTLAAFSGVPIPGYAIAQSIATGLVGFANVKKILAVNVPKGNTSMSQSYNTSAPISPTLPMMATQTTLNQNQVNQLGNAAARAYVVESDITNQQERIKRINRAARLN